jgi:hypothetical protein
VKLGLVVDLAVGARTARLPISCSCRGLDDISALFKLALIFDPCWCC